MPDPIAASIALGVAGNLASAVVQSRFNAIHDTRVGRALSKLGLLRPDFDERLRLSLVESVSRFLSAYPLYHIEEVNRFLSSKLLVKDLAAYLLDGRRPDINQLAERLATYVGVPVEDAPSEWPNRIDPTLLIQQMLDEISRGLALDADPGLIWLSQSMLNVSSMVSALDAKLESLADDVASLERTSNSNSASRKDAAFDASYREHLLNRFRKITTPGARELHGVKQTLSVAYISLNIKSDAGAEPTRAEQFLIDNPLVTIKGPAGSGKTTLLSWIITNCCNTVSSAPWKNLIPFFVPLRTVARLEEGAPLVENFVSYSVDRKLWSANMPKGYIERVLLQEQRGVVMLDGVDELPATRREEFWEWLASFTDQYPGNRVIVTSRALPGTTQGPHASKLPQWCPPSDFVDAQLQEMSNADVTEFVYHWHDAVDQTRLDTDDRDSLLEARGTLPSKLEDPANRRIRELCGTPLLCAMVCVLHWREEGYLPKARVEVYERCCDMLIEARDLKRQIVPSSGAIRHLTKNDKEMVVQHLAIEMMRSQPDNDEPHQNAYRIEISREKALKWIRPKIASFQDAKAREATAEEVLDFLIERTGLLREPATDLVDFPHRTFQEYMAACAAGAESQEQFLAKQANDDQWHETIMLAAGTKTGGVGFGRELIDALLKRGLKHVSSRERQQKIRKTCFALALGCLENLKQGEPALRDRVLSYINELVPPRNELDARILSVAGDAATSYLNYARWKDEDTGTVAACSRALRLIGTSEAIRLLKDGYRYDSRSSVLFEVYSSEAFDLKEIPSAEAHVSAFGSLPDYASSDNLLLLKGLPTLKILTVSVGDSKHIEELSSLTSVETLSVRALDHSLENNNSLPCDITNLHLVRPKSSNVQWLDGYTQLKELSVVYPVDIFSPISLPNHSRIAKVTLLGGRVSDVETLRSLPVLSELSLISISGLSDFHELSEITGLSSLTIVSCDSVTDFSVFQKIPSLRQLTLAETNTSETLELESARKLESLTIKDMPILKCATLPMESLQFLNVQRCNSLIEIEGLSSSASLLSLQIGNSALRGMTSFNNSCQLKKLDIKRVKGFSDKVLASAPRGLEYLDIAACHSVKSFDSLQELRSLNTLRIGETSRLDNLHNIRHLSGPTVASFNDCATLDNIDGLEGHSITRLELTGLEELADIDVISSIRSLQLLNISSCPLIQDLTPLMALPNLSTIIVDIHQSFKVIPESLRPKITRQHHYRYSYPGEHFQQTGPGWYYHAGRGAVITASHLRHPYYHEVMPL